MYGRQDPRYYDTPDGKVPSVTTVCSLLAKPFLIPWAANEAVDWFDHNYLIDGGVKAIGKKEYTMLSGQARTAYKRKSEEAMQFGSDLHELCEKFMQMRQGNRGAIEVPRTKNKQLETLFMAFMVWYKKHNVKPISMETVVYGDGYAGRVDLICEIDSFWMTKGWCKKNGVEWTKGIQKQRVIALIDFKTGKGIYYPEWGLQTAAYRRAYIYQAWKECEVPNSDYGEYTGTPSDDKYIQHHGVLKFNKETLKVNYKDMTPTYERDYESFMCLVKFFNLNNEAPK